MVSSLLEQETQPDLESAAHRLIDDPVDFFDGSYTKAQSLPKDYADALQLKALKIRFETLRYSIPIVKKLADAEGLDRIDDIEDIIPLLFDHTTFKSYPHSLIDNKRFDQMTKWLGKLTTHDLSQVDASGCQGLDDWFTLLDRTTPLRVSHSSGTTGSLALLPWCEREWEKFGGAHAMSLLQRFGEIEDCRDHQGVECIYPYFRSGAMAHMRCNDQIVRHVARGEEHFHAVIPHRMSSDVMYLSGRIRDAKVKGRLDSLKVDPVLLARKAEFDSQTSNMDERLSQFFDEMMEKLAGKRVFLQSTWNTLYNMALSGLERGMRNVFAADSIFVTGGGAKGLVPPPDWREKVCEFTGVSRIGNMFGMSEVMLAAIACEEGHFHFHPWTIPFLLDPETSKPLPRTGVHTGRAAYFDLTAESHWGGFITGDEVTMHWDANCSCGRKTPFIEDTVVRYSEKQGGDDKITCAATQQAHDEAMEFLNEAAGKSQSTL